MKHSILRLSILALLLAINTVVYAYDFEYDKLQYNITSAEDKTVEVCGNRLDQEGGVIPEYVEHNGVTYSVTKIGNKAFYRCQTIKKITIPNSIKHIGGGAFASSNLEQITIPNSVEELETGVFFDCKNLSSVSLPNGITKISHGLFQSSGLKKVSLPNSITEIEADAFRGCKKLESIDFPNKLNIIRKYAFSHCVSLKSLDIPDSVTSIEGSAFVTSAELESITIANEEAEIGDRVVGNCKKLKHIDFQDRIKSLGDCTFYYCESLESADIPSNITSMRGTFFGCEKLKTITIPSQVTEIGGIVNGCAALKSIYSLNPTPPVVISDGTFEEYHYRNTTLYVPKGSAALYWLHPYWEKFYSIVEMDASDVEVIDYIKNIQDLLDELNS